jgi:hypothetical protein
VEPGNAANLTKICNATSGLEVVIQSIPTFFTGINTGGFYQNLYYVPFFVFLIAFAIIIIYFQRQKYKFNNLKTLRDILVTEKVLTQEKANKWPSRWQSLLYWIYLTGFLSEKANSAEKIYLNIARKHLKNNQPDLLLAIVSIFGFFVGLLSSIFDFQGSDCSQTISSKVLFTFWFFLIFVGIILIYNLLKSRWLSYFKTLVAEYDLVNQKISLAERDAQIFHLSERKNAKNLKFQENLFKDSVKIQVDLAFSLQEFSKDKTKSILAMRNILNVVQNLTKSTWLKDFYEEKLHLDELQCSILRFNENKLHFVSSTRISDENLCVPGTVTDHLYQLYFQFARSEHQYIYFDSEVTIFPNSISRDVPRELVKSSNYLVRDKFDKDLILVIKYPQPKIFREHSLRRVFRENAYTLLKTAKLILSDA